MAQGVLIEIIIEMILISLNPFVLKRVLLFFAAAVCLSCVSCFAQPMLFAVQSTPYDNQMSRVRPVLQTARAKEATQISLTLVNHWIESLRVIPYAFSQQWKTPAEVDSAVAADCKGKAVALYEKMQQYGASNIRIVIGKRRPTSRSTHTWLEWSTANGMYVLDPTINWMACKADQIGKDSYVPFYAYAGSRKYRAASATLLAKN
jgi:predicted transglutaminase-like cysteine proteinase